VFRGPGIENTGLALFKNIGWGGKESRTMQFRIEAYKCPQSHAIQQRKHIRAVQPNDRCTNEHSLWLLYRRPKPPPTSTWFKISF
jgi:hypothetical protein